MFKGFGTPPEPSDDDSIWVESIVGSRELQPLVEIRWGKYSAQFTPAEAREHAYGILQAAAAAELDSALTKWANQKLGLSIPEAAGIRALLKEKRENNDMPSITLNLNGERLRPEMLKRHAEQLLEMAFHAEVESFLVLLLLEDLNQPAESIDYLIQEFREMLGLKTQWPKETEG